MNYTIRKASWTEDQEALQAIRRRVFIEEQAVPEELEWDEFDTTASHWLATLEDGQAVGTVRMLRDGHIGRMAVLADHRGAGIGRALLDAALAEARDQDLFEAYLYAQVQAMAFYHKAGFDAVGEEFMDANIPHRTMRLQLAAQRQLGLHGGNFAPDSYLDTAVAMIDQTRQHLRIVNLDLNPHVFDTPAMENAISALARRSRFSDIRLLVIDTSKLVHHNHSLLRLQRRLSSTIKIRRPRYEPTDVGDNLILADRCGILCQSMREGGSGWANFNNRPVAETYIAQFDDMWERAIEDPDLRLLEL